MTIRSRRIAVRIFAAACVAATSIACSLQTVLAEEISDPGGIFAPGAKLTRIVAEPEGLFYEGPAMGHDGMLYFSDLTITPAKGLKAGITWKHDPDTGKTTVYRSPSGMSNGIAFDAQGRMIVVHQGDYGLRYVSRTDMSTGKAEIVAAHYGGHPFNAPNDVIVDSKGRIFFTDPMYDHRSWEQEEQPVRGVYRIDTDGSVHLVVANVRQPNGLALSPDESILYVCNYDFGKNGPFLVADDFKGDMPPVTSQLFSYDLRPDGTTKFRKILIDLTPQSGCDGIKVDEKGNLYVAAGAVPYLYVYSPDGQKRLATITLPDKNAFLLNINFGRGKYAHTLFIAARDGIYKVETKYQGAVQR